MAKKSKTQNSFPFAEPDDKDLISKPRNRTTKRIFIAATRMNDGKTTVSLALFAALRSITERVGFIKPIGQRFVDVDGHRIDEDSFLLNQAFDVEVPIQAMSPIAIDSTFTRRFLDNPDQSLEVIINDMCRAFDRAAYAKDYIIVEGTGHAGVGAVFNMSNAAVAKTLDAKVILVSRGGIGRPIDELALNKALFDREGVEVIGAIINKVLPEKMEVVAEYARKGLDRMGVPLLGCIPVEKQLAAPSLAQIVDELGARWLNGRSGGDSARIGKVVIGAMTAKGIVDYLQPGNLIVTPGDREDIILSTIAAAGLDEQNKAAGLVLTDNVLPHPKMMNLIAKTRIPVVISEEDSFSVATRINKMTIKTQPSDTDKIPIIKSLITDNVNLDMVVGAFRSSVTEFPIPGIE